MVSIFRVSQTHFIAAQHEERDAKRQKVHEDKDESGLGFSVEQLVFNRGKPENAMKLENYPDDYYHRPYCLPVNEVHPEEIEHHAGEIAYTWYNWTTNKVTCPVDACLPPAMTCTFVTGAYHAKLMKDMRHIVMT